MSSVLKCCTVPLLLPVPHQNAGLWWWLRNRLSLTVVFSIWPGTASGTWHQLSTQGLAYWRVSDHIWSEGSHCWSGRTQHHLAAGSRWPTCSPHWVTATSWCWPRLHIVASDRHRGALHTVVTIASRQRCFRRIAMGNVLPQFFLQKK